MQRVPVRITLDPKDLVEHPLRVGLSMDARVDISQTDGRMLASAASGTPAMTTNVFDADNSAADADVRKIITSNGGRVRKTTAVAALK